MGPERRGYKYRSSHSEELLRIAVFKKLTKSLKSSGERAPFLVKLEERGERISVSTFASPLALQVNER